KKWVAPDFSDEEAQNKGRRFFWLPRAQTNPGPPADKSGQPHFQNPRKVFRLILSARVSAPIPGFSRWLQSLRSAGFLLSRLWPAAQEVFLLCVVVFAAVRAARG